MAQIGAIYEPTSDDEDEDPTLAISYLTSIRTPSLSLLDDYTDTAQ